MLTKETILHVNMISIKDYIYLRETDGMFSNVSFQYVKHLNLKNGSTFWQELQNLDSDYIPEYEPTTTTINKFKLKYNIE